MHYKYQITRENQTDSASDTNENEKIPPIIHKTTR